jgi:hypothetical protein
LSLKGDPLHDGYAALKQAVEEAIKGGYLRFEYQDLELAAQTLWAAVHGVASLHIVLVDDPWFEWRPLEVRAQAMIAGLLHGLVTSPQGKPS